MDSKPFQFEHPSNVLLVGPTGSGKTQYLVNALYRRLFNPFPQRIVWVYAEWQEAYAQLHERAKLGQLGSVRRLEFIKDATDYSTIYETMDPRIVNMLVLDDQMTEAKSNTDQLANLFVKGSHHRNITIVFMLQNMFEKCMRTVSLNAQYMVLMKNPRDKSQIGKLAEQIDPERRRLIIAAFTDATRYAHSHFVIDLSQNASEELRFYGRTLDPHVRVYVPEEFDTIDIKGEHIEYASA